MILRSAVCQHVALPGKVLQFLEILLAFVSSRYVILDMAFPAVFPENKYLLEQNGIHISPFFVIAVA